MGQGTAAAPFLRHRTPERGAIAIRKLQHVLYGPGRGQAAGQAAILRTELAHPGGDHSTSAYQPIVDNGCPLDGVN